MYLCDGITAIFLCLDSMHTGLLTISGDCTSAHFPAGGIMPQLRLLLLRMQALLPLLQRLLDSSMLLHLPARLLRL